MTSKTSKPALATIFPPLSEKKFMAMVIEVASLQNWLVYHTFDSRRSSEGFPDLVMVRKDRLIFAELKSDKGKQTYAQSKWAGALVDAHAEYYLWRPCNFDWIMSVLK